MNPYAQAAVGPSGRLRLRFRFRSILVFLFELSVQDNGLFGHALSKILACLKLAIVPHPSGWPIQTERTSALSLRLPSEHRIRNVRFVARGFGLRLWLWGRRLLCSVRSLYDRRVGCLIGNALQRIGDP